MQIALLKWNLLLFKNYSTSKLQRNRPASINGSLPYKNCAKRSDGALDLQAIKRELSPTPEVAQVLPQYIPLFFKLFW